MPLHAISESDLRNHCRRIIEALELWLRRLIHDCLSKAYGADYINATNEHGINIISNSITRKLCQRVAAEPDRYERPIDAATLEHEVNILCKPELYKTHFEKALESAFPDGAKEAKTFLTRLIDPRNRLYHANTISVRQAEQIICYSNDTIYSLKDFYRETGMSNEYNVPTIIRIVDSFGATFYSDQIKRDPIGRGTIWRNDDQKLQLRPGDTLSLEADIDPSFDPTSYTVTWSYKGHSWVPSGQGATDLPGNKVVIVLKHEHVRSNFQITCKVISHEGWHKFGNFDDQVSIVYKVLPPLKSLT